MSEIVWKCKKCGDKTIDQVRLHIRKELKKDGTPRAPYFTCLECNRARRKIYGLLHKDKIYAQRDKYFSENPEKKNEYNKRYYEKNREKRVLEAREYRKKFPEKSLGSVKKYYLKNIDKKKEYSREYDKIYRKRNAVRYRQKRAANYQRNKDLISDIYVKDLLVRTEFDGLDRDIIPTDIIELKRVLVMMKRKIRIINRRGKDDADK